MSRSEHELLLSIAETVREIAVTLSEDINLEPGRRRELAAVAANFQKSIAKVNAE
jgi:hypothetical protein